MKIIHIQDKTRAGVIELLAKDYQVNWQNQSIEFPKERSDKDGSPLKPIIGAIADKHITTMQWTITPKKWNKFRYATLGNGGKGMIAGRQGKGNTQIPRAIIAALSDFHVQGIITKSAEEGNFDKRWRAGKKMGHTIWTSPEMKNIYDDTKRHRELIYTLVLDQLDWKLVTGHTTAQVHRGLIETLKVANVTNLSIPSRAIYGWYNLGRKAAQKMAVARSTVMRLLNRTYKDSYWYIRTIKLSTLLHKIKYDPHSTWHNDVIRRSIIRLGIGANTQECTPPRLAGSLLKRYNQTENNNEHQNKSNHGNNQAQLTTDKENKENHPTANKVQGRLRQALQEIDST